MAAIYSLWTMGDFINPPDSSLPLQLSPTLGRTLRSPTRPGFFLDSGHRLTFPRPRWCLPLLMCSGSGTMTDEIDVLLSGTPGVAEMSSTQVEVQGTLRPDGTVQLSRPVDLPPDRCVSSCKVWRSRLPTLTGSGT